MHFQTHGQDVSLHVNQEAAQRHPGWGGKTPELGLFTSQNAKLPQTKVKLVCFPFLASFLFCRASAQSRLHSRLCTPSFSQGGQDKPPVEVPVVLAPAAEHRHSCGSPGDTRGVCCGGANHGPGPLPRSSAHGWGCSWPPARLLCCHRGKCGAGDRLEMFFPPQEQFI